MGKEDIDAFVNRACELGAVSAKIVKADTIVTAPWVRLKCQFGCRHYHSSHCCPPSAPTPDETQNVIDCYSIALLIHFKKSLNATDAVAKLEKEIFLSGFYKALGFGAGPCRLCKECDKEKCLQPETARSSMEGCGIDVYATVTAHGYPIEVLKDKSCEMNCYGLILIE